MSFAYLKRAFAIGLMVICAGVAGMSPNALGQEMGTRKAKSKVQPTYPELARRMKISGVVKVQVVVTANGAVKDAKVIGGHPVLASAVLEAVRKWHYETRPDETTENLEFHFDPAE